MNINNKNEEHFHVIFPLKQDDQGYPPANSERMWVKKIEDNTYVVDNIPFFVKGVSSGDKIEVEEKDGALFYKSTLEHSKNSTLRVIVFKKDGVAPKSTVEELIQSLKKMGLEVEASHLEGLFAVEIPEGIDVKDVINYLETGAKNDLWDYEEASLR